MSTKLSESELAEIRGRLTAWENGNIPKSQYPASWATVDRLLNYCTALESELKKWQSELAEAAREINCAGPVSHRIRVLKREHEEQLTKLESELKAAQDCGDGHHIAERILIEFQEGRLREGDVKGICQNIQRDAINNFRAQLVEAVREKEQYFERESSHALYEARRQRASGRSWMAAEIIQLIQTFEEK